MALRIGILLTLTCHFLRYLHTIGIFLQYPVLKGKIYKRVNRNFYFIWIGSKSYLNLYPSKNSLNIYA